MNCVGTDEIDVSSALATIFLLSIPRNFYSGLSDNAQKEFDMVSNIQSLPTTLESEVKRISNQMETMADFDKNVTCNTCGSLLGQCKSQKNVS